nr:immunoglobulin light chain junction region [Macaca mulatta]MOV73758.1 immunoglobulin light chain junction region [Macaca mulatta]
DYYCSSYVVGNTLF